MNPIITFTGNRDIKAKDIQSELKTIHSKFSGAIWRSGMAYGLDMAVAQYAAQNNIPFEAYLQCSKWNKAAQDQYFKLLEKSCKVFTHSKGFSMGAYQFRNVKMAEGADLVIAFNRHTHGGTVNMINHCVKNKITVIDGFNIKK